MMGRARVQSLNDAPHVHKAEAEQDGWRNCSEALVDGRVCQVKDAIGEKLTGFYGPGPCPA